eukprot:TRINITY_DN1533_c0_g1_i3.p2 TRINITY_DN1533_c0_g1~~TRINITY_DN1533_c0_g1_i3.p2  ORF type:complete len:280 (+),score=47.06 TRINITY_DN1533_c0_g1_i3:28-840(+)
MDDLYDFIVVGSGPAGSTVASRLARTSSSPNVLLLEAGASNDNMGTQFLSERFMTAMNAGLNWGYKTVPQKNLNNRSIDYLRGKGLGGSSSINFSTYTIGPRDDYDEWARRVGDESFNWWHARRRYNNIENYDVDISEVQKQYVRPATHNHGHNGPLRVQFPKEVEWPFKLHFDATGLLGMKPNLDINSGDPIGVGSVPMTSKKGIRDTAASAFLCNAPPNLKIVTLAHVEKIIFDGKRAVGVKVGDQTCKYSSCFPYYRRLSFIYVIDD